VEKDPGIDPVKKPWKRKPEVLLTGMYFLGGSVWWLLAKALPDMGVPPLCITLLWVWSYIGAIYLGEYLVPHMKR